MTIDDKVSMFRELIDNHSDSDNVLAYYLDIAGNAITEIRFTDIVEPQYENLQIQMAIDIFNKRGAEGQVSHSENGISRGYEAAGISPTLLGQVTPFIRTPSSVRRVIVIENS